MKRLSSRRVCTPTALMAVGLVLLSGAAQGAVVFRQSFQSSTSVDAYEHLTNPHLGQFNDIDKGVDAGTISITQHRLRFTRTGSTASDNGSGFVRTTDFSGPPSVLHLSFDVGVISNDAQNDAMALELGDIPTVEDYDSSTPTVALFSRLNIDLAGSQGFRFEIGGVQSANFPADGTMHTVSYFLNGSGTTRSYLAPDGSTRSLGPGRVALWAGTTVLFDNVARTHANPALTNLRVRFPQADLATWELDNIVISNELPVTRSVTRFSLINADTDQPIARHDALEDGDTIQLGDPALGGTRNLNIQAHTYPLVVGSVRFALDANSNFRTESTAPYALAGDTSSGFNAWTPEIGIRTLKATPFSGSGGTGTAGTALTISFMVGVDPRSSLAVTEQAILDGRFSFQRVMDQLVAQSGVSGMTSLRLFQQWWDTQNPAPGLGLGPHCTDNSGLINSYPYVCRPADGPGSISGEGSQALINPFTGSPATNRDFYKPIGLFNRFDLAAVDGTHCGEYRMIFARAGAASDVHPDNTSLRRRNLVIFESVLPNPQPALGLEGCRPVAEFWANLSRLDAAGRAAELERFYFVGLTGFAPVVHFTHYGKNLDALGNPLGQVRTNQFLQQPWMLREFRLVSGCAGSPCLRLEPTVVRPNPFGPLFGPNGVAQHSRTPDFRAYFPSQVSRLSASDINDIGFRVDPELGRYNAAQSPNAVDMNTPPTENNYAFHFQAAPSTFRSAIASQIPAGSGLTPEHIVLRAQALSCAGCHQLNNNVNIGGGLVWPPSNVFVQVSELDTALESGPDGPRFNISPALEDVFLPRRKQVLENFLTGVPSATQLMFQGATASGPGAPKKPAPSYVPTLGGSTTH